MLIRNIHFLKTILLSIRKTFIFESNGNYPQFLILWRASEIIMYEAQQESIILVVLIITIIEKI